MITPSILPILDFRSISTSTPIPSIPSRRDVARVQPTQTTATADRKSMILHDGKNWTIVPTAAVLFLPPSMTDRVNAKPLGRLLLWPEFLEINASWIATEQVTLDQASRITPLPASQASAWPTKENLVVAVRHNKPVSVTVASVQETAILC